MKARMCSTCLVWPASKETNRSSMKTTWKKDTRMWYSMTSMKIVSFWESKQNRLSNNFVASISSSSGNKWKDTIMHWTTVEAIWISRVSEVSEHSSDKDKSHKTTKYGITLMRSWMQQSMSTQISKGCIGYLWSTIFLKTLFC